MVALANVWDLIARDAASPVFNRVAVSADRAAVATERATAASAGFSKTMKAAFAGLAIGAVGVEMVKSAVQFQKSMLLIQTQAGASAKEVQRLSTAALGLAGRVATAPEELAKSLYHVESAGLRGAKALNVAKIAAEGAKVGNADLEETTNALTSAVVSGIGGVKNMQQAMGVLNGIVGTGDMRLSDLNDALGTGLLASARVFGVSIQEVGAALAVFGDNNIRGADAATKLRMVMQDLSKPAAFADKVLSKVGLSADQLRSTLTSNGLNAALQLLKTHMEAAGVTGSKVGSFLEDAFTKKAGVGLAILETQLGRFETKLPEITKKGNEFGADWAATTKTASFAFDRIKATVEAFGISIGTKLLPYVSQAAQWLGTTMPKVLRTLGDIIKPLAQVVAGALTTAWRLLAPVVHTAWNVLAGVGHFLANNSGVVKAFGGAVLGLWAAFKGYAIAKTAFLSIRAAVVAGGVLDTLRLRAMYAGDALRGLSSSAMSVGRTVATAVRSAGASLAGIPSAVRAAEGASGKLAAIGTGFAGAVGAMAPLALGIGAVGGALWAGLGAYNAYKQHQQELVQETQSFTNALLENNGALGANTRLIVAQALQSSGAYDDAQKLGLSIKAVTDAVISGGVPLSGLKAQLAGVAEGNQQVISTMGATGEVGVAGYNEVGQAAKRLAGILTDQNGVVGKARHAADQLRAGLSWVSKGQAVTATTARDLTSTLRSQVPQYSAVFSGAKHSATGLDVARAASDELKQATNTLKDALKGIATRLSNAAEAVAWQQSLNDLTQTFKDNKAAIEGHSAAALADRAAFIADAQQIVQNAQAMEKHGASTQKVTGYLRTHIAALKDAAIKAGADKGAVNDLATALGLVPKDIKTEVDIASETAMQRLQDLRDAIHSLPSNIGVSVNANGNIAVAGGGSYAAGGAIRGRGTSVSDSIPARLSNGEHVLTASDVQKAGGQGAVYRMRQAIQSGALRFANGGAVSSLMSLIRRAGFSGSAADIMYGIIEAESGGNRFAHNTNASTGDNSYGLAQINMIGSMGPQRRAQFGLSSNSALFDPLTNLRVAYALSSHGHNFSPWTTFTSGAYRKFLNGSQNDTVSGGGGGGGGRSSRRSSALSTASSLISNIGQQPNGPQFQLGDVGIRRVTHQIAAAQSKIAALGNLRPKDRARFAEQIAKLVRLAQRQFDKLVLRIKKVDIGNLWKALKGTAADVRTAFGSIVKDLRAGGAGDKAISRLRTHEAKLLTAVNTRNRLDARLANIDNRMKQISGSVRSGVLGSFDVTSAGVNPVTGRVGGGSLLAQQTQALNRTKRFVYLAKVLERRKLVQAYLNPLLAQGPAALPQLEALAAMGDRQFATFNAQEQQIARLAGSAGAGLARHDLGSTRQQVREDRQHAREVAHEQGRIIAHEMRDILKGIKVNGVALFVGLQTEHRKADRRHGVPGGKK